MIAPVCTLLLAGCGERGRRDFFVETTDGAHLKVSVQGNLDSDVLLLVLHGGPAGSSYAYSVGDAADALEDRYAVAYLDQRGQGASQGSTSILDYGLQRAADDVDEVLQVLRARYGEDRTVVLWGHSWGGTLGTVALLDTPAASRVDGWIEVAGCHDSFLEPRYIEARFREVAPIEIEADRDAAWWESVVSWFDGFDSEAEEFDFDDLAQLNRYGYLAEGRLDLPEEDSGGRRGLGRYADGSRDIMSIFASRTALITLMDEWLASHPTPRLGEITLPAVYIYGDYDFVCPTALGEDAVAANPNGELVRLEQSGHSLMRNETAAYLDAVSSFIDGL